MCAENSAKVVVIVGGMGGVGKTTLASAFCRDPEVREFFRGGIHFVTVSQSPNMMKLLTTIRSDVTGGGIPYFQNVEDAHNRVRQRLEDHMKKISSNVLLVLDDVWSEENLEKLTFEGVPRFWTLVTSRHAHKLKAVQQTPHIHDLNVLDKEYARQLFCYWAFRKDEIPRWADRELVEEVISECKGLPLALKVIGASLATKAKHDNFKIVLRFTRDKLRQAEHEDKVFGCLRSSVDVLGSGVDVFESQLLHDCFMDLGAFREDTSNPIDNLLDIWVYVRGMTWDKAYCTLLDFQSRCLLDLYQQHNFDYLPSLNREFFFPENITEYGCGGNWSFSQHDVLRDLAIHLARNDPDRRWLLMPQPQPNVPQEWQCEGGSLAGAAGVADVAQVISIHISGNSMSADDWPSLHFPDAKALLLHMNSNKRKTLPSFIRNMLALQVLVIKSKSLIVNLQGLCCLQSLYIDADEWTIEDLDLPNLKKLIFVPPRRLFSSARLTLSDHTLAKLSSFLEILIFSCYNSAKIPKMHFKKLEVLHIHCCYSLCIKELPNEIGELERLKRLVLFNFNRLEHLPLSIGKLSCLKELVLYDASQLHALPEDIIEGLRHQLETLELIQCFFPLPSNIGRLQCLKKLRLHGFASVDVLPESLVKLQRLEVLDLRYFYNLKELPDGIGQLPCLRELFLEWTPKLRGLPESLVELTSLEALILKDCKRLTDKLSPTIKQLPCLKIV